ncbi:SprT-like domain-containing protein [Rhodanobacter sp. 115]|uniref:SprT-like domain-containing protein n=1 Tax=Rhodanobacter sp. FW021-MT20 TaxID=1162282 RepID=UPI0034E45F4D
MYPELQHAYDFFNQRLFAGMLPPCLITLNRSKDTFGYFSPGRFVRFDGQLTHEIALNPAYFAARPLKETLSTLVHEQVHLWQETFGSPGRGRYHNAEWASMCEAAGLMPSDTGAPGGRRVGDRVSHYIIDGGPFDRAADALLTDHYRLSWIDRFPVAIPRGADIPPGYVPPVNLSPAPTIQIVGAVEDDDEEELQAAATALAKPRLPDGISLGAAEEIVVWPTDERRKPTRSNYRCPDCGDQVWGKCGMDLSCNPCHARLVETPL